MAKILKSTALVMYLCNKRGNVMHKSAIQKILEAVIIESCDFEILPNKAFRKFHSAFLKYSFGALNVEIDYRKKIIMVWSSKPLSGERLELYNEDFLEKVRYTDLEETLLGCVEPGVFNERFYKHLLYDLDRLTEGDESKTA